MDADAQQLNLEMHLDSSGLDESNSGVCRLMAPIRVPMAISHFFADFSSDIISDDNSIDVQTGRYKGKV